MREVDRATAVAGQGLEGDHVGGGPRQITLLDLAAWRRACSEIDADIDPGARRANVVIAGVDLAESRGRRLRLGEVEVEIGGETRPCEMLTAAHTGLCAALRAEWRGGAFGRIVAGGELRVGDEVGWSAEGPGE